MAHRRLTRRDFLHAAVAGGLVGSAALAGVTLPQLKVTSASSPPELPQLVPTVCGMCDAHCGVLAYLEDGRLHKLEGNFNHSHSQGRICARGAAAVQLLYDPDRVRMPLKRVDSGKLEPTSWNKALREVGNKLLQVGNGYGRGAVAWASRPDLSGEYDRQFMSAFGSPNLFSESGLTSGGAVLACQHTVGAVPIADFASSRYIMFLGRNPTENIFVSDLYGLMEAKGNGAHIVVADPRLTNTAAQANEWIPVRPGTEGALLLAMINVVLQERLYDRSFVERNTVGFEELRAEVEDKTPAWAEVRCDVPASTIHRLAIELAGARPSCSVDAGWSDMGGALYANSVQTVRAALTLNALMGSYGAQGGLLLTPESPLASFNFQAGPAPSMPRIDGIGVGAFPLLTANQSIIQMLPNAILSAQPYPIRALVVHGFDLARLLPNTAKVREALRRLELVVVIDSQLNDTAQFAHYVLPASTFLERFDLPVASARMATEVALRQPVLPAIHDTLPPHEIVAGLARSAGLGEYFDFTLEGVTDAMLAPTGLRMGDLQRKGVWRKSDVASYGPPRFATGSGKVELYLDRFREAGFAPLPTYEPPLARPQGRAGFRLLNGRETVHAGNSTHGNRWLDGLEGEDSLWINGAMAARLGIGDGDLVRVESEVGEVATRARVTQAIHPEAVFLSSGRGNHGEGESEVRDSVLLVDRAEPVGGGGALNETVVRVRKVGH